ncbi:hypothetical protein HBH77_099080 [Parastagonospora nodorum]|nr:hypothetical protein HBI78_121850 [Parastagonospora nodorum]KAH5205528.1 hypothetical protein HBH77_099080 [Parastagonospora nodorum]
MPYNFLILYYLYTNRQNKLIDKIYKYIASYNKLFSVKHEQSKTATSKLTSKYKKKATLVISLQLYLNSFS